MMNITFWNSGNLAFSQNQHLQQQIQSQHTQQQQKLGSLTSNIFGGNSPDEVINANKHGVIPNVGEINNLNSTSEGLKIWVTINNLTNLLEVDDEEKITDNLFLKVYDYESNYQESDYLTYKFSKNDFYRSTKDLSFLFYPGLIEDGKEFKVCISYSGDKYNDIDFCKRDFNKYENKQETITFDLPKIINLDDLIVQSSKNIETNKKSDQIKKINISKFDSNYLKDMRIHTDLNFYHDLDFKYIESINKLITIDSDESGNSEYLTQISGSNLTNYNETKISGNDALSIWGFEFDDRNNKIYAFGKYYYFEGTEYEKIYGLAEKYNDYTIFVIDPDTARITNTMVLWNGEEEGDETSIENVFIDYDENKLYVIASDEGDLDNIYVIDTGSFKIESVISIYEVFDENFYYRTSFDKANNILYTCDNDQIIGINIDDLSIEKNFSSDHCLDNLDPTTQLGYYNYIDITGFIDLKNEVISTLLIGGNVSDIDIDGSNNTAYIVGHSSDAYGCSTNPDDHISNITSYVVKMDIKNKMIVSIYETDDIYIDSLDINPHNNSFYVKINEIEATKYYCNENSKLFMIPYGKL